MTNRFVHVVLESQEDAELLRNLLPPRIIERCKFVVSDGKGSAVSTARTLLIISQQPVAVLVNADTDDEEQVAEEQSMLNELMGTSYKLSRCVAILAVPNLETAAKDSLVQNDQSVLAALISFVDSVPELEKTAA